MLSRHSPSTTSGTTIHAPRGSALAHRVSRIAAETIPEALPELPVSATARATSRIEHVSKNATGAGFATISAQSGPIPSDTRQFAPVVDLKEFPLLFVVSHQFVCAIGTPSLILG